MKTELELTIRMNWDPLSGGLQYHPFKNLGGWSLRDGLSHIAIVIWARTLLFLVLYIPICMQAVWERIQESCF